MSTSLVTVTPETLVEEAATLMLSEDISSLIVTDDDGELAGILTTTDFVDIVSKSHPKAETAVSRYMTTDLYTTTAQTPIQEVAEGDGRTGIHHARRRPRGRRHRHRQDVGPGRVRLQPLVVPSPVTSVTPEPRHWRADSSVWIRIFRDSTHPWPNRASTAT